MTRFQDTREDRSPHATLGAVVAPRIARAATGVVALLLIACCRTPGAPPGGGTAAPDSLLGAKGDGVADDREAIQAAIDRAAAGNGEVYLPAGTFSISRAGRGSYGLKIPGGVRLHGAGRGRTVLQQAPGTPPSVRLLAVSGDRVAIEDLTLDGNKRAQTPDEQRHGVFAQGTDHLQLRGVTAQNFTGDGFYLYKDANHSTVFDVVATSNDRNGITLGGNLDGTLLINSKFIANKAQQVDSEPGGANVVSNTRIVNCDLDGAGVSNQYALTCSGTSAKTRGRGWSVVGNRINGGIFVVWAEDVLIAGNVGINATTKPSVTVYRSSAGVDVLGNSFQQDAAGTTGILIEGTAGGGPERVVVAANQVVSTHERSFGVRAIGAQSVAIVDNVLRGAGRAAPGFAGVVLRATNPAMDFERAIVSGNRISNYGARGVTVLGNGPARLLSVAITDNIFEDSSPVPAMTVAISLDDGTGAAREISVIGNKYLGGVRAEIANYPANVPVLVGGVRGAGGTYSVAGSPEGTMAETAGAIARPRDAGPAGTYYVKRTGKDSKTGWMPVTPPASQ